jgi:hypothetical protein
VAAFSAAVQEKAISEVLDKFTGGPLREVLGLKDFKPESFGAIWDRKSKASEAGFEMLFGDNFKDAFGFMQDGAPALADAVSEALAAAGGGPMAEAFSKRVAELAGRVKPGEERNLGPNGTTALAAASGRQFDFKRPEASDLEKIGAIFDFGGGTSIANSLAEKTANATERTAKEMEKLNKRMEKPNAGMSFANI